MIIERHVGGETQGRGLFGGKRNPTRTIGLGVVFVVGCVATMMWQGPGLVLTLLAGAIVWVATLNTHNGSLWKRVDDRRRWKASVKQGLHQFVPVDRRPAELEEQWASASRRQKKTLSRQWTQYRDWPDGVEGMNWLQDAPGTPGIIWHTPSGQEAYFTVCFPVRGQIQGLEADSAINNAAERFGRMLAGWSSPSSLVSGVQVLTHVLPIDSARHEKWVLDNFDPNTPYRLLQSYDDVVKQTGRGGLMQRHYVVVRWPATPAFRLRAEQRAPGEEGWRLLLQQEIKAAWRRLHAARFEPGDALTATQFSAVLRHLQMPSWPIDQAGDVAVKWPWMPSKNSWSYVKVSDEGPEGEHETWYHRTARIPADRIGTGARTPLWLLPFLTRLSDDVVRTISIEIETVPASTARASARADLASDLADMHAQRKKGSITSEELEVALAAANARRDDLKPGRGAGGAGFAIHVSISATSESRLTEACTVVKETLTTDLDVEDVEWLDPDQAAAAAACWPVARGMRPVQQSQSDKLLAMVAGKGRKDALT